VPLDTSVCNAFLRGGNRKVRDQLLGVGPEELRLCSVVKAELLFGARRSKCVDENLRELERFFTPFVSLPFDDTAASHYGSLRQQLEAPGRAIGANDMMIAATALAWDLAVATLDHDDFRRGPGLRVAAW
jgi:tRNA(fMet)-specific endonuclease VapC